MAVKAGLERGFRMLSESSNAPQELRDHVLDTTGRFMEIDLLMKGIASEQKLFRGQQRLLIQAKRRHSFLISLIDSVSCLDRNLTNSAMFHQPIEIDSTSTGAGHKTIAAKIVETIGVKGA